ncbi:Na+/H+ antiporter subunit E [Marinospirillum sp.]|uniref:Na+/H+ antiporter subunit E n=1 Tax=Marinospirillum sp. TaxID=2183934 RepID=UPI003A852559
MRQSSLPIRPQRAIWAHCIRAALLLFIWWVLTEGALHSWLIGLPTVLIALMLAARLAPVRATASRFSLWGLVRFIGFFLRLSIVAGFDVAWRLIHPQLPIQPGWQSFKTRLPAGRMRWLLAMTLSLLPGTITRAIKEDRLELHALDVRQHLEAQFRATEAAIAAIFSYPLEAKGSAASNTSSSPSQGS